MNEDSADLRVTLNRADGSGTFGPFLSPPQPIGVESSPNESCDLDNDSHVDIAVSSTNNGSVFVVRGKGDGTWKSAQEVPLGTSPETHGVAVLPSIRQTVSRLEDVSVRLVYSNYRRARR